MIYFLIITATAWIALGALLGFQLLFPPKTLKTMKALDRATLALACVASTLTLSSLVLALCMVTAVQVSGG